MSIVLNPSHPWKRFTPRRRAGRCSSGVYIVLDSFLSKHVISNPVRWGEKSALYRKSTSRFLASLEMTMHMVGWVEQRETQPTGVIYPPATGGKMSNTASASKGVSHPSGRVATSRPLKMAWTWACKVPSAPIQCGCNAGTCRQAADRACMTVVPAGKSTDICFWLAIKRKVAYKLSCIAEF